MRLVFDLIASLKFLLFDSPGDAGAVIRANYDVYRIFRHHSGKRKRIKRDNKTLTNVYHRSVVLSYYLRGKKYFFNLGLIIPDTVIPAAEPFPEIHREGQGQVKNYRGTESDE
jgi:hypothetical protein